MHGITAYFLERARFARRVSLLTIAVGVGFLVMLWAGRAHPVRDAIDRTVRIGYEGPDQFVRRISLQPLRDAGHRLNDLGHLQPAVARRGGAQAAPEHPRGRPKTRPPLDGPGSAEADLMSRLTTRLPNVPVVQSQDLAIAHAVNPTYPPTAYDQDREGKVWVQVLIDTAGRVADVQLISSSGTEFERAATEAVWQWRFHPHRIDGAISQVYADLYFAFRIYY